MKIGSPTAKREEIIPEEEYFEEIDSPEEETIEPEPQEEPVETPTEEPKEPEKEKTVEEDVMRVVDIINSLKSDKEVLTQKISTHEKEKADMVKKHQEELKVIKDAIKKAIYK